MTTGQEPADSPDDSPKPLCAEDFEAWIGQRIRANPVAEPELEFFVTLESIQPDSKREVPAGFRQPFSLLFRPLEEFQPPANSQMYHFHPAGLEGLELFAATIIIPQAGRGPEPLLEVIFA